MLLILCTSPYGSRPSDIAFVDLSGFTTLTEERGDQDAAEQIGTFAQIVRQAAGRHEGRIPGTILRLAEERAVPA